MGTEDEEPRLGLISAIGSQDSYLAVVSTLRSDGTPHSSLVNAAVVAHPMAGAQVGAFVTYGPVKLAHLRRRPALTLADIGEGRHAVATLRLTGQLVPHIARSRHLRAPESSVTAPRTCPSTTSHFRHRVHRSRPPQTPGSGLTRSADLSQR